MFKWGSEWYSGGSSISLVRHASTEIHLGLIFNKYKNKRGFRVSSDIKIKLTQTTNALSNY